jgi:hypothetical protein
MACIAICCPKLGGIMKRIITMATFVALIAVHANSQQPRILRTHNGFLHAEDFLDMDPEQQKTYSMGLVDGMYMAPFFWSA